MLLSFEWVIIIIIGVIFAGCSLGELLIQLSSSESKMRQYFRDLRKRISQNLRRRRANWKTLMANVNGITLYDYENGLWDRIMLSPDPETATKEFWARVDVLLSGGRDEILVAFLRTPAGDGYIMAFASDKTMFTQGFYQTTYLFAEAYVDVVTWCRVKAKQLGFKSPVLT